MSVTLGFNSNVQGAGQFMPGPLGLEPNPMFITVQAPWDGTLIEVDTYRLGSKVKLGVTG